MNIMYMYIHAHTCNMHVCTMYIHVCYMYVQHTCTYMYNMSIQYIFSYGHCTYMYMLLISVLMFCRWTQEQPKKVIAMLQDSEFYSKDIDPDLHKRTDKAVQDDSIKCFNIRES